MSFYRQLRADERGDDGQAEPDGTPEDDGFEHRFGPEDEIIIISVISTVRIPRVAGFRDVPFRPDIGDARHDPAVLGEELAWPKSE